MDVNEVDALGVGAVVTSTTTKESRQLSSPANLGGEAAVDGNLPQTLGANAQETS